MLTNLDTTKQIRKLSQPESVMENVALCIIRWYLVFQDVIIKPIQVISLIPLHINLIYLASTKITQFMQKCSFSYIQSRTTLVWPDILKCLLQSFREAITITDMTVGNLLNNNFIYSISIHPHQAGVFFWTLSLLPFLFPHKDLMPFKVL